MVSVISISSIPNMFCTGQNSGEQFRVTIGDKPDAQNLLGVHVASASMWSLCSTRQSWNGRHCFALILSSSFMMQQKQKIYILLKFTVICLDTVTKGKRTTCLYILYQRFIAVNKLLPAAVTVSVTISIITAAIVVVRVISVSMVVIAIVNSTLRYSPNLYGW